jgi:hypothetical protein
MEGCMFRLLSLSGILLFSVATLHAQSVTGTFRNAVNANPVAAGTLSLYNIATQQWVFQNEDSPHQTMIFHDTEYRVKTDPERLSLNELFKHHLWDYDIRKHLLSDDFSVSQGEDEVIKTAVFTEANKTTLFHNFEEFTDEGSVRFRDPWYVNANQEQTGDFESFASPHVPTGAYGEDDPAVLLGKQVREGDPFYSLKYHSFLQSDYETPAGAPLTNDNWVFIGAYAREAGDVDMSIGLV